MGRLVGIGRGLSLVAVALAASCDGTPPLPPALTDAVSVSVGVDHACAVMGDGTARCWGLDAFGELGDGQDTAFLPTPTPVAGLTGVKAVTAGASHTCALKADGTVACWGGNVTGQIGDGCARAGIPGDQSSALEVLAPTAVTGLTGPVAAIQASSLGGRGDPGFTCALLSDGTIECWGGNLLGLGPDPSSQAIAPTAVPGVAGAVAMAIGGTFGCDLQSNGLVACWGVGPLGQPGTVATSYSATPVVVPGLTGVKAIAAGSFHACALLDGGTVVCWGDNSSGQLGDGTQNSSPTPVTVSNLGHAVAIATTAYTTCAVIVDGSVQCWGVDLQRKLPSAVPGVSGATAISVGELSTCAVVTGGQMRCWGDDTVGQLGDGVNPVDMTNPYHATPVTVVAGP
jgi:alpha-tubulin suppressor-like RCC1 family protein